MQKKQLALLTGINSKNNADFFYLNSLYSLRIENKLNSHEKICKNEDFYGILLPLHKDNTLYVRN